MIVQTAAVENSGEISTGKLGIWWLIGSEIMIFGGAIGSFILLRLAHPDWADNAGHLSVPIGSLNTLVLLTSSYTMVKAFENVKKRDRKKICRFLLATALMGLVFLGIKSFEYHGKFSHGIYPNTNLFWAFYFTLTGLHALHVIAGITAILILWTFGLRDRLWPPAPGTGTASPGSPGPGIDIIDISNFSDPSIRGGIIRPNVNMSIPGPRWSGGGRPIADRIELVGLYWHFVDVVWIFLLPLLYLTA